MERYLDNRWNGYSKLGDDSVKGAPSLTRIWRGYILCLGLDDAPNVSAVTARIYDPYTHEKWSGPLRIPFQGQPLSSVMPPVAAYAGLNIYVFVAYNANPVCVVIPYPAAADRFDDFSKIPAASLAGQLGISDCDFSQRPAVLVLNGQILFVYRNSGGGLSGLTGSPAGGKIAWQPRHTIPGVAGVAGGPSLTIFKGQAVCAYTSSTGRVMTVRTADGGTWSTPAATPASTAAGPALSTDPIGGRLNLLVASKDQTPVQIFTSNDNANWRGPAYRDGITHDAPALIASASRKILAAIRGADNHLWGATTLPGIFNIGALNSVDGISLATSSWELNSSCLLLPGDRTDSKNGLYYLTLQTDGNLVLYTNANAPVWASGTDGHSPKFAVMQWDGNLVLYDVAGNPYWASGTDGNSDAFLRVQDDGNAVIYLYNGIKPVWATNTSGTGAPVLPAGAHIGSAGGGRLPSGGYLMPGQRVTSADNRFYLIQQTDGNLTLYSPGNVALWASHTDGRRVVYTAMQPDGNLVVYDMNGRPLWASGTSGNPGASLVLATDGNLEILNAVGHPIWATNTAQPAQLPQPDPAKTGGAAGGLLPSGNYLLPNQHVTSTDGRFSLTLQTDGNLVLQTNTGKALWASHTDGHSVSYAAMQPDGNLVVYDPFGKALWASGTAGNHGASLSVQPDGNSVIYNTSGHALWATGTVQPAPPPPPAQPSAGQLAPGHSLTPGQRVASADGHYFLTLQDDGNLVLYTSAGAPIWASHTDGHRVRSLDMQTDGNLVIYDTGNHPIWASHTDGRPGASLIVETDGNAVIYDTNHHALWATGTARAANA